MFLQTAALGTAAACNKGFFSIIIYVRHFRLCAWFTHGIQAVRGRCRRFSGQFSQIWSDVVISHTGFRVRIRVWVYKVSVRYLSSVRLTVRLFWNFSRRITKISALFSANFHRR